MDKNVPNKERIGEKCDARKTKIDAEERRRFGESVPSNLHAQASREFAGRIISRWFYLPVALFITCSTTWLEQ